MNAFIWGLEEVHIDYRIIDKSISRMRVLLKHEDRNDIIKVLQDSQFEYIEHFMCKAKGYFYKYQLHEFETYIRDKKMIEIYYELPCVSLTPKILLPLDKLIQQAAWEEENQIEKMKFLPENVYIVFLVVQCVFFQNKFSNSEKRFFLERKEMLQTKQIYLLLNKIFFSYTDRLLELLIAGSFNDIYSNYIRFIDY